ncbi:X-linked retinitis pigmentosa GTPase regulator-like protein [Harpegnathos saltator]|uniref:X-linked retinitis pigmentosa GTPase regulator-like protein n=1 Tax=Harpegnathos saltator TaxID=610380 RepID=E2BLL1_HARSA|nr:X-linked retinitis pigmentosa GTPase regulator-like protein [Harpegnathos saltator]
MSVDIGIIGTECGAIILINLSNGQQMGIMHINGSINSLQICQNENNEGTFLLITNKLQQQWRLLLEQHTYNFLHNLESKEPHDNVNLNDTIYDNIEVSVPSKSKLQELKQLSVEKLAILKQKLIETKNQTLRDSSNSQSHDAASNKVNDSGISTNAETSSESKSGFIGPEPILKDTFLSSQYDREGRQLYTYYHPITNHITVHGSDLAMVPLSIHKIFDSCDTVLLAHKFFFVTDINQHIIYIISDQLSETHINGDCEFNFESVVGVFSFKSSKEIIRAVYKVTKFNNVISKKVFQEIENKYTLAKNAKDLKIEIPTLDACIIVTNRCVYEVILRKSFLSVFMELVLKKNELEKAGKLATIFGLNGQHFLEYAGDIFLSNKEFARAITAYKISKCKLLKSVLKFASVGHTSELLSCLTHCLLTPAIIDMHIATRIHLSNLCVLAFIEMTLRVWSEQSKAIYKEFLYFLSTNTFYDELLAINIAGQTYLWEVLHHLATQRSLYSQMLDILMKAVQTFGTNDFHPKSYGVLICLSESGLMQAMLLNHELARSHMMFVRSNLRDSQIFVLQRLVTLYDPTNPVLRTRLMKCKERHRTTSHSRRSSQCDSTDVTDNIEELQMAPHVNFKKKILSTGFSHVALIRNANVYTWGSSVQGCLVTNNGIYVWGASQFGQLGLGKVLQCSSPELVTSLAQEIIVDAVAGQYHSVALTADGRVFTWGWGVHGQLGHGNTDEKSIPTLVTSLLGVVVCHISAGYAHTLALSVDGFVYAFGCNVLGQLGVGSNNKSSIPMKVSLPEGIKLISTGYFHNLVVSNTNKLYTWGASPQALRLQAQAQKKSRILEQQDASEKRNRTSEDLEKMPNSSLNLDEEMKEFLENNIQTKSAQTETTSNIEIQKKLSENSNLKNLNTGFIEEDQTHLKPSVVDTSLVKGQITQISAGCHHNALITKDGSLYTWGRNFDGQIGNGTRRDVPIPTPLYYNSACIFAQIPPRHNDFKRMQNRQDLDNNAKSNDSLNNGNVSETNGNISNAFKSTNTEHAAPIRERINPIINTVVIACGYDYTVAIQPGGTVLAWGNNSRAQLGRIPARDTRETDEKLVLLKSSKRVVRLPHTMHVVLDVPSQVPGISTPVISYQTNDTSSLAGFLCPLSMIEKTLGELTLHYVLEYFHGLYCSGSIMEKCMELENYQACSKVAALDGNILAAFNYQLKMLHKLSLQSSANYLMLETSHETIEFTAKMTARNADILKNSESSCNIKRNTELFNKQAEKNLMESLEDSMARSWAKIPTSRSLNNLQTLAQELYTFDCQGGLEELCRNQKNENPSANVSMDYSDVESNMNENEQQEWIENFMFNKNDSLPQHKNVAHSSAQNLTRSICTDTMSNVKNNQMDQRDSYKEKNLLSDKATSRSQRNYVINETIKALKFYLSNIANEANTLKCELLQSAIDFWIEHDLPIQSLENIFLEYIYIIYYPLGLLLFCQNAIGRYLDANKYNNTEDKSFCVIDLFSIKFCLQVLSLLLQHIDQDEIMPEYIKIFSCLMADYCGAPLNGYPGASGNNSPEQMMEGIISTIFSEMEDSKLFAHIKDSDAVHRLLMTEEDSMVFTCGHHFPMSVYDTEIIPTMETELLMSPSLVLPCTSQYLGNMFSRSSKLEILCPLCIVKALRATVEKNYE